MAPATMNKRECCATPPRVGRQFVIARAPDNTIENNTIRHSTARAVNIDGAPRYATK